VISPVAVLLEGAASFEDALGVMALQWAEYATSSSYGRFRLVRFDSEGTIVMTRLLDIPVARHAVGTYRLLRGPDQTFTVVGGKWMAEYDIDGNLLQSFDLTGSNGRWVSDPTEHDTAFPVATLDNDGAPLLLVETGGFGGAPHSPSWDDSPAFSASPAYAESWPLPPGMSLLQLK
jgi:hypothetical protein